MPGPWEDYKDQPAADTPPWEDYKEPASPGIGSKILGGLQQAGRAADYAFGAPVRAGVGALQTGKNPLAEALMQYGKNPESAPTAKEIVTRAGVPSTPFIPKDVNVEDYPTSGAELPISGSNYKNISPAGAAAIPADAAMNLLNIAPGLGALSKLGTKAIAATEGVPYLSSAVKAAQMASEVPGDFAKKVISYSAATPAKAMEIYSQRGPEIRSLLAKYGNNVDAAADSTKENILNSILTKKNSANSAISSAFENSKSTVPSASIVQELQRVKGQISKVLHPSDVEAIDGLISEVNTLAPDGNLRLKDAYDVKKKLQDIGSGEYLKNGQIFKTSSDETGRAAKNAATKASSEIHAASPEIASADQTLSEAHDYDKAARTLLGTDKTSSAMTTAGGGENYNTNLLRRIGNFTGTNPVSDAEMLYGAKAMVPDPNTLHFRKELLKFGLDAKNLGKRGLSYVPTGAPSGAATLLAAPEALNPWTLLPTAEDDKK